MGGPPASSAAAAGRHRGWLESRSGWERRGFRPGFWFAAVARTGAGLGASACLLPCDLGLLAAVCDRPGWAPVVRPSVPRAGEARGLGRCGAPLVRAAPAAALWAPARPRPCLPAVAHPARTSPHSYLSITGGSAAVPPKCQCRSQVINARSNRRSNCNQVTRAIRRPASSVRSRRPHSQLARPSAAAAAPCLSAPASPRASHGSCTSARAVVLCV